MKSFVSRHPYLTAAAIGLGIDALAPFARYATSRAIDSEFAWSWFRDWDRFLGFEPSILTILDPWTFVFGALPSLLAFWLFATLGLDFSLRGFLVAMGLLRFVLMPCFALLSLLAFHWTADASPPVGEFIASRNWLPYPHSASALFAWCLSALEAGLLLSLVRMRAAPAAVPASAPAPYGDRSPMNATRLAAAGMIGVFGSTRARLLAMARDRHRAVAPEPGLDLQFLSGFAQYLENRARRFRIGYAAIGLLALLCAAAEAPVLSVLLLLVAALIAFAGLKGDRGLRERLQVRTFDLERLRRECWAEPPGSERDLLAGPEQNLVVYSGFSPFGFAGVGIGSWSVAIDVERGREEFGSRVQPTPFTAEEVYARLCSALTAATNADVKIQDCAFASGVGIDPALFPQRDRLQKPSTRIDPARLLELVERRDPKLRHYKWARVEHPPSEIVLSYFLRCGVERKNLFVEVDRVFLGPVEEGLHQADELPPWELVDSIAALQGALVLGPVLAGWNLVLAPFRVLRGIGTALGLEERALRKAIRRNPRFDFGAAPTLRQSISSTSYRHYYERVDKELGQKAIDREIFNTLVDFLHERGVDVSELREGQASILNNGIIVQQGDLNSSSVAVGENSRAAVIRRKVVSGVQKVTRKPASAPAGG